LCEIVAVILFELDEPATSFTAYHMAAVDNHGTQQAGTAIADATVRRKETIHVRYAVPWSSGPDDVPSSEMCGAITRGMCA
jgi:hypothetical protein